MRVVRWELGLLILGLSLITGCSLLEWFAGVDSSGRDLAGPSPAETAGGILGTFLPGAGAALAGVGGIIAAIRGRQWKKAALTTFDVIGSGAKSVKEVRDLKSALKQAHAEAGVAGIVKAAVKKSGSDIKDEGEAPQA